MKPIVLDISRTVTRAARGQVTGIDRVELAYIQNFLNKAAPVYYLARFHHQSTLLDHDGMRKLWEILSGEHPWDAPDRLSWIRKRKSETLAKIDSTLRRLALAWPNMVSGLRKHVPSGFTYLNVGHGVLHPAIWKKLRKARVGKICVLVHDVIPLDYPEFCRPDRTADFETKFHAAVENADVLVFNSMATKNSTDKWLRRWDIPQKDSHIILLGTDALPAPGTDFDVDTPYFVTLGTIEPRKNHRLLLNIWQGFHENLPPDQIPHLYIVGARGWMNEGVFETLDTASFMGKTVHEVGRLPDDELATLLSNSHGLLFPSFAEGFGYPLVEAMLMGTPAICSNLACFAEISKTYPCYLDPQDANSWKERILALQSSEKSISKVNPERFAWARHFDDLDTMLGGF